MVTISDGVKEYASIAQFIERHPHARGLCHDMVELKLSRFGQDKDYYREFYEVLSERIWSGFLESFETEAQTK